MKKDTLFYGFAPSVFRLIGLCIFFLSSAVASGQAITKPNVSEADYPLWHYVTLEAIADNGAWVSYHTYYQSTDTLFIRNRKSKKTLRFAKPISGTFKGSYYVCQTSDDFLHIVSLETAKVKTIQNVQKFEAFSSFIVIQQKEDSKSKTTFMAFDGTILYATDSLVNYAVSNNEKWVSTVFSNQNENSVVLFSAVDFSSTTLLKQPPAEGLFLGLTWHTNDKTLAFFDFKEKDGKVHSYSLFDHTLKSFATLNDSFPKTMHLYPQLKLKISDDGKRVFFMIRQRKELNRKHDPNAVQIWNSKDKAIVPLAVEIADFAQNPKQAMWEPATGRFLQITDPLQPFGAAAGAGNFALTFNPQQYEPQTKIVPDTDYYIKDLNTGASTLLVKQINSAGYNVLAAATGKYIAYFSKGHWFIYTVETGKAINVTNQIVVSFSTDSLMEKDKIPYGSPGWTSDGKSFLLYDAYDIWRVQVDGSKAERLTNGREEGIQYRLIPRQQEQELREDGRIFTSGVIDLTSKLLLSTRSMDNDYNGFSIWNKGKGIQTICYARKKMSSLTASENGVFAWMEEDVNQPPTIVTHSSKEKSKLLFASNPQHKNFNWTKNEIITYKTAKGEELKGILYYPAGFISGTNYPMVVHIYEKQSPLIHTYTPPSLFNGDGFNTTNLTSKGYFVFLPDITYEIGEIGTSALDCVEAGVRAVLAKGYINADKMGLIGHSFGGTETDYIITQSNLFACAVAGAATTNFLSSYLSVSRNYGVPNFSKMEYGQARMLLNPYENMQRYLKNSAIMYADKVNTPLLSWTGLLDQQVDATQSMEFYMALRRLNKEHVMLVYPNAEHDMSERSDEADLTKKIEEWFDYYLKDATYPKWL